MTKTVVKSIDCDKCIMPKDRPEEVISFAELCKNDDLSSDTRFYVFIGAARQGLGGSGTPIKKGELLENYKKFCESEHNASYHHIALRQTLMLDHLLDLGQGSTFDNILNLKQKFQESSTLNIDDLNLSASDTNAYDALANKLRDLLRTVDAHLPRQEPSLPTESLTSYQQELNQLKEAIQTMVGSGLEDETKEQKREHEQAFRDKLIYSDKEGPYKILDKTIFDKTNLAKLEAYPQAQENWLKAKATLKPVADDKILLYYSQIHEFARQHPEDEYFEFHAEDNDPGILQNAQNFFEMHPEWLPSNCIFKCEQRINEKHVEDKDCQRSEQEFKEIKGQGQYDEHYAELMSHLEVQKQSHQLAKGVQKNDDGLRKLNDTMYDAYNELKPDRSLNCQ